MKSLRVVRGMSFPHQINSKIGELATVSVEVEEWNEKKKCKEFSTRDVMVIGKGELYIIADPASPIKVDDDLQHLFYPNMSFKVKEILEERKAQGDWSFTDIEPIFQRVRIELN